MDYLELRDKSSIFFNYLNGKVNQINTDLELTFIYDSSIRSFAYFSFPNIIAIKSSCCNIKDEYADTVLLSTIIHELYHADQYILYRDPRNRYIEYDADFMTYTYIKHNSAALKQICPTLDMAMVDELYLDLLQLNPTFYPGYTRIKAANYVAMILSHLVTDTFKFVLIDSYYDLITNLDFKIFISIGLDTIEINMDTILNEKIKPLIDFMIKHRQINSDDYSVTTDVCIEGHTMNIKSTEGYGKPIELVRIK